MSTATDQQTRKPDHSRRTSARMGRVALTFKFAQEGKSHVWIAKRLGISTRTVRDYLDDPLNKKKAVREEAEKGSCAVCGHPTTRSGRDAYENCVLHRDHPGWNWDAQRVLEGLIRWYEHVGYWPNTTHLRSPERQGKIEVALLESGECPRLRSVRHFWGSVPHAVEEAQRLLGSRKLA